MTRSISHIYRDYDIRGQTSHEITPQLAQSIGSAIGRLMRSRDIRNITVARDARDSGPALQMALMQGLADAELDVIDLGEAPTPLMYFAVDALGFDSGVIVTASHNPVGYNGFKIRTRDGTLFGEDLQTIATLAAESHPASTNPGQIRTADLSEHYIQCIANDYRGPDRPLRVVVDAGNGVAGPLCLKLLARLNVETIPLYCIPDGQFPNHPANPTVAANMNDLRAKVMQTNADLGIGLDGDGDRIGAVTATGDLFFGDTMIALFAQQILARTPGHVIADVKCSRLIHDVVAPMGGTVTLSRTGYPWIQQRMSELNASIGGELSGHICFADRYYGFDDGLYAASRLIEMAEDLQERLLDLPRYHSIPEHRIGIAEEHKGLVIDWIQNQFVNYQRLTLDGVRFSDDDGWGLIRASNTEPCLTVRAEATNQTHLLVLIDEIVRALKDAPAPLDITTLITARSTANAKPTRD